MIMIMIMKYANNF